MHTLPAALKLTLLRVRGCFKVLFVMHCVNYRYLNFNRCSREQRPLKTVGKAEFWNWNNLVILRGEFTFDLMGRSFTVISTRLSRWIWIRLVFLWWKYGLKMVKIYILCIELRVVCTLTVVMTHMRGCSHHRIATRTGVEPSSDWEQWYLSVLLIYCWIAAGLM